MRKRMRNISHVSPRTQSIEFGSLIPEIDNVHHFEGIHKGSMVQTIIKAIRKKPFYSKSSTSFS